MCVYVRARDSALFALKENAQSLYLEVIQRNKIFTTFSWEEPYHFENNVFDTLSLSHNTECLSMYEDRILHNAEYLAELTQEVTWNVTIYKFDSG